MKPGNRLTQNSKHGAKSCSKKLKDEKMVVSNANLFFLEEVFYLYRKGSTNIYD